MRLTNYIRDAFVRNVMNDVPSVDYETQIRDLAMKEAVKLLLEKVRCVWEDSNTRDFIRTDSQYIGGHWVYVPCVKDGDVTFPEDATKEFKRLRDLEKGQEETRASLESKVRAVAYSVTTVEKLIEQLPEFEKYLPADVVKARQLPAVANLVTDLLKAGWPDGGKKKETAEA